MSGESRIQMISVDLIIPNRFQPRLVFDEAALNNLAASIKEHGIIQPLVLRKLIDKYEIIAGERRYKAAIIAGLSEVPAIVAELNDNESAEIAIVENLQRSNLNSLEEAKSFKKILDKGYLTQEKLAQRMGISQSSIANKLRLLNLAPEVQNALMQGKISERHARSLLQLNEKNDQINLLNRIIAERLTVRQLDEIISNGTRELGNVSLESKEDIVSANNSNMSGSLPKEQNSTNIFDHSVENLNEEDKVQENKNTIDDLLKVLSPSHVSSLEDEETNMTIESENNDNSNVEFFNPFIADEELPDEAETVPTTIEKEEIPISKIVSGDLESVKIAYNVLKDEIINAGFKITSEDFDFEDIYQLIIKIDKQA